MWQFDPFNYSRRPSKTIQIGSLLLGGSQPVRVQSMANTDTNDTKNSVEQCIRIIKASGELVRFTTQGIKEAENVKLIHDELRKQGFQTPLVADIHFNANAADVAARNVEKVRINPGNYVGSVKIGDTSDYTDEEFELEYQKIRARFIPFLNICKENNTTIRIGVNHGSLSERMMNRYGDTSRGMVESCLEFLLICQEENFDRVVISMKTSNTVMMVQTVRLLVETLKKLDLEFPIHLGVTEAGDGEDGRIKSAVGIGALLADGIGDTIRVSLSEEPEDEIPVGRLLVNYVTDKKNHAPIHGKIFENHNRFEYNRRVTHAVQNIGGEHLPVVIASTEGKYELLPDYIIQGDRVFSREGDTFPIFNIGDMNIINQFSAKIKFLKLTYDNLTDEVLAFLKSRTDIVILLHSQHKNSVGDQRAFFHALLQAECTTPVILCRTYNEDELQQLQIKSAADLGVHFIDGFGDGIALDNQGIITPEQINSVAFGILQASRVRVSKTEFISCPSCGRTMFHLQTVVAQVKARTSHLKGLKIGIMGCIVNGPGEMADADYGYVGAGKGKISLYKRKQCIEKNIPEAEAVDKLVSLIKANGDWHDE